MLRTATPLLALMLVFSCAGKKARHNEPIVGWHQESGWPGACFHPVAYDALGPGDRKLARQDALKAMMSQWQGQRGDGVSFDGEAVTELETVLLGLPDLIEQVSVDNLAQCQAAMKAGGDTSAWSSWLRAAPDRLTEGHCRTPPMDYQLFDYLDIGRAWQIPVNVCQFDRVEVKASSMDEYQIEEKGPWINAAGDPARSSLGTKLPCNFEGCLAGMVILRFTGESGTQQIVPIGLEKVFEAPEHGRIEIQINDDTWYDNKYRIVGRIEHHTAITYQGQ